MVRSWIALAALTLAVCGCSGPGQIPTLELPPVMVGTVNDALEAEARQAFAEGDYEHAGYKTGGLVSHTWVGNKFNFHLGFDHWDQENALGHEPTGSGSS